jgi:hypothetical protein
VVLLVPCLLVCLACATPFPIEKLKEGMTAEEARQAFGEPHVIRHGKVWIYTGHVLERSDYYYRDQRDIYLHFEGGKLARWHVAELGPDGIEKSIVAIKFERRRIQRFLSADNSYIFFVRLGTGGQYRQGTAVMSNHRWGDYAYLLNASPGRYAAIGQVYYHEYGESYVYYPETMIHGTIVTVEPSGVAFMGEFELSGSLHLDEADDTQMYYFSLFRPGYARSKAVGRFFQRMGDRFVAEYRKDGSEMANQRFLQSSRWLAEFGWRALITQETAEDRDNKGAPGVVP